MKAKSMILIIIALSCGLVASIGISQVMVQGGDSKPAQMETQKILVAMRLIDIAEPLNAENVKLEEWPKELIPEGTVKSLDDVKDKYSKSRVVKGQAILRDMLVDEKQGIVPQIPQGYRVTSIKVSIDEALSGLLQPGDRVDITGYFRQGSEHVAATFLHDVQVFAVNEKTERIIDTDGKTLMAKTVSLLVTPQQVQKVLVAKLSGNLHLSLRNHSDTAETKTDTITLNDILHEPGERGSKQRQSNPSDEEPAQDDFKTWLARLKNAKDNPLTMPVEAAGTKPIVMMVYTPNGAKQYVWNDPQQLPAVTDYLSPNASGGDPVLVPANAAPATPTPNKAGDSTDTAGDHRDVSADLGD